MSEAIGTLGQISVEYARKADEYEGLAVAAADAESAHKKARGRFITSDQFENTKTAVSLREYMADADENVSALLYERLHTGAVLDAAQKKLQQLRERIATGRTYAATEREVDKLHAVGIAGAS